MFISKLIRIIDDYDPFGIFRINGIKVVYVALVLFAMNGLFYIPDVYFYFFYIPLTAMTAEVQGTNLPQKYLFFTGVILGTIIMVMLFNLIFSDVLFFLFFSFIMTFLLYAYVIHDRDRIFWVPIILSLVSYSLNYRAVNQTPWDMMNHAILSLAGMLVVLGALLCFPLSFYYRIWLRTFYRVCSLCLDNFLIIQSGEGEVLDMPAYIIQMRNHAHMLPRRYPVYSILNMTFRIHQLYLSSCVYWTPKPLFMGKDLEELILNLQKLVMAIKQEIPCQLGAHPKNEIEKIIYSWNYAIEHL